MIVAAIMVWIASPPGSRPAHIRIASNRSLATPERSRSEAIMMNIGTETSAYSFMKL
jgi:hypothetical protein